MVQHIIVEAQRSGSVCAIIAAEHALDPEYAHKVGVDVDKPFISQPDSGEQAMEIAETLVRTAAFDVGRHRLGGEGDGRRPRGLQGASQT